MGNYTYRYNPISDTFDIVQDISLIHMKDSVDTYNDLPITGNSENDARFVKDTDILYVWSVATASGNLTDWKETAKMSITDLDALDDGTTYGRVKNSELASGQVKRLDDGTNEVTAEDAKDAVDKKHNQNTDVILLSGGSGAEQLFNSGILKTNLLVDDGINIQIDEIRARDGDGLKLYDDGGNGIFIEDGGNVGIGTTPSSKFEIALGATEKVYIDGTTIDQTGSDGALDIDVDAGADSVSGLKIQVVSQGDYTNVLGANITTTSGGMSTPSDQIIGLWSGMIDNASDVGSTKIIGVGAGSIGSQVASIADWIGFATVFDSTYGVVDLAGTGSKSCFWASINDVGGSGDLFGITLNIKNNTNPADYFIGAGIVLEPNVAGFTAVQGISVANVGSQTGTDGFILSGAFIDGIDLTGATTTNLINATNFVVKNNGDLDVGGNLEVTGELSIKVYSQTSEPVLGENDRMAIWIDTDDSFRVYLVFRRFSGDDQVFVELA